MHIHHERLHQKAILVASEYLKYESKLIDVLQELDTSKTYLHYEQPSLFAYATKCLTLSESVALTLIGIARKSKQVPELKQAIEEKKITVTNARRIVPILTQENKVEWLEKAASLPQVKLEKELAKSFPETVNAPTKLKYKSEFKARLETDVPTKVLDLLKRAQEILSQQKQSHVDVPATLESVLEDFVQRHDPVQKAQRAITRKVKATNQQTRRHDNNPAKKLAVVRPVVKSAQAKLLKSNEDTFNGSRVSLSAELKHAVILRDQNRCTHVYRDTTRCVVRQWLDVHHIVPVSYGGANTLENLRTLCSAHHRMEHASFNKLEHVNINQMQHRSAS